jgi:arylsulfatase A-like enzyme
MNTQRRQLQILFQLTLAALLARSLQAAAPPRPHSAVVVVIDGLRPDFVSPETTPQLAKLAAAGVFFAHHHPVYLSSTEVNGTALATGSYPAHSGIIANNEFRPRLDPQNAIATQAPDMVRRGDELSGGHYLARPTVAEILHAQGLATAIAGSKPVALLHDRALPSATPGVSALVSQGEARPEAVTTALKATQGALPSATERDDKTARDDWTTQALLGTLWREGVPPYSLLWLAEPDSSQHASGLGSAQSLAALKKSDEKLGLLVAELTRRGELATTNIFIVSDHGFSTIAGKVDLAVELSVAGFSAKRVALGGLKQSEVLVVGNGGSSLIYVGGHDAATIERVVTFLQQQSWTGVIFSRSPLAGAFPLAAANIDAPEAPDLVVSFKWQDGKNAAGVPGLQISDLAATSPKLANHASLSPFDMHNTLVAVGPDIRAGVISTLPSGNLDVAPTILWLLGLKEAAQKMDGRVLSEALTQPAPPLTSYELKRLNAQQEINGGRWTQYLQISEVNGVRYLDAGNGEFSPAPR